MLNISTTINPNFLERIEMLTLQGKLVNVIRREPRPDAEKKFDAYAQAQIQTEEVLDDGQVKVGLHTLSFDISQFQEFEKFAGKEMSLSVRAYARGNSVAYAIQAGSTPRHCSSATPQS